MLPFAPVPAPVAHVALAQAPLRATTAERLRLDVRGETLSTFCERIAVQLQRPVVVEAELRDRRVVALSPNVSPANALAHLAAALRLSLRETGGGYEVYRSEEQKKREQNEEASSRARHARKVQEAHQQLRLKLSEAMTSPKLSLGTFLRGFTSEQQDSMLRLAQEPMGILHATSRSNLKQRTLFLRPFRRLSPADQTTLRTLLRAGGYEFSGVQGPPENLANASVGVVAAFGALRLGIIGADGEDVWYDPANAVSAPSAVAGQRADPADYNPNVEAERRTGRLVRGVSAAWRAKAVRFAPLDRNRHLPAILSDVARQTGLSFFGASFLHTDYPTASLEGLRDGVDIPLLDVLLRLCRAYGQRMEVQDGVVYVSSLTPGLDRRLEPSPAVAALFAAKNASKSPTITLKEFTALCALSPAQLFILPRSVTNSRWVQLVINELHDRYLSANFYAALSDAEREQAMQAEGLDVSGLRADLKARAILLSEAGPEASAEGRAREPLRFYVKVAKRPLNTAKASDASNGALQKVTFTFASRDGRLRDAVFSF